MAQLHDLEGWESEPWRWQPLRGTFCNQLGHWSQATLLLCQCATVRAFSPDSLPTRSRKALHKPPEDGRREPDVKRIHTNDSITIQKVIVQRRLEGRLSLVPVI
ncbi:MAG: hypothetical protein AB1589_36645 [Cyanobacteriota bacterium]